MRYSHVVGLLAYLLFSSFAFTSEADVYVVNGSHSNTLFLVSVVGDCYALPGQSFNWPIVDSTTNHFGTNGGAGNVTNGLWISSPGHDYRLVLGDTSGVAVFDLSTSNTYWFWYGLVFGLGCGLLALGARWVRITLVGGLEASGE